MPNPRITVSRKCCCVPECTNNGQNCDQSITFHKFPSNEQLKKLWIVKIRRDEGPKFQVTTHTRVCSDHFYAHDFRPLLHSKRHYLKQGAYPTRFNWISTTKQNCVVARASRNKNLLNKRQVNKIPKRNQRKQLNAYVEDVNAEMDVHNLNGQEETTEVQRLILENQHLREEIKSLRKELEDQKVVLKNNQNDAKIAKQNEEKFESAVNELETKVSTLSITNKKLAARTLTIANIKNSDKLILFYSGFENAKAFQAVFEYLKDKAENLIYWHGNRTNVTQNKNRGGLHTVLTTEEMFFLTLLRIKMGFPVVSLEHFFGVSQSTVTRIFTTWISFLYHELKEMFPIPPPEFLKTKCAPYFTNYSDTTLIIDCSEIKIQTSSRLGAQQETFSNSKHSNTYKFLVAITSNGQVVFVSPLYGGSASDKRIVQDSGFLDELCPGHNIMADKRFEIENLLPDGVALNVPPKFYKRLTGQISVDDVAQTRTIASELIECAIRRIKTYKILSTVQPLSSIDLANQIVSVCSYLTNFKPAL